MYLFFFAPVKDDKKLTDIMLSKVGCSDYVSMLNERGIKDFICNISINLIRALQLNTTG